MKTAFTTATCLLLTSMSLEAFAEGAAVNCETAQADITKLEGEKKNAIEQIALGTSAVTPSGFVLNTVFGTEKENQEIGTGEYNQRIDQHIALIKSTCGIERRPDW